VSRAYAPEWLARTSGHPSRLDSARTSSGTTYVCKFSVVRLNAWLARAGVASRRKADELIKAGRVTVNGEPGRLNTFVASRDRVELDGEPLAMQRLAYVLLHKPTGVVTTASDPQGRPTVVSLASCRWAASTSTRRARCS